MADIRTINPAKYNSALAAALKSEGLVTKPEWVDFVKTGLNKQRPTADSDFWYKRAAGIMRQIYVRKIVGVERLRTRYGGRKDRGMQPATFAPAGGSIIRKILQQLDASGLTEKATGKHKGRQLTAKGKQFMESLAK
ncbi:MAG TPA: 40S ribosomal protein S19 [Candidatus Nanoarchaeia archaeon]|nr:40S ribosomal protein S19 [Candidatus Nanoarchaeia archaeon]